MDSVTSPPNSLRPGRAYYVAPFAEFLQQDENTVLGELAKGSPFAIEPTQRDAWIEQVSVMKQALAHHGSDGLIAFEFAVPRMGKRIDVLLVAGGVVFVLEFKVGERTHSADGINQVWDYALDLKNFHSTSHHATIAPILIATKAPSGPVSFELAPDGVGRPLKTNATDLGAVLRSVLAHSTGEKLEWRSWIGGSYKPTPTIIEAAMALYGGHGVEDISRREADAINLTQTLATVESVIREARAKRHKAICFVTGVPGAGKTLVGLDVATKHVDKSNELYSVFLSGNGPLVSVLCEALAKDRVARSRSNLKRLTLKEARREAKAFIQNVHHFRDDCLKDGTKPPVEHVALFDEAQRAWNKAKTQSFMQRRNGHANFSMSEPAFLISCLDRHRDWAVVVCLVGGGQEINDGEAGIGEWVRALKKDFPHWRVHLSPNLGESEYAAGQELAEMYGQDNVLKHQSLHLSASMRSFRSERVSAWVKAVLDLEVETARQTLAMFDQKYPIVLTRDLNKAKAWVRGRARGSERYGMLVSSKAHRLKPEAIDVRVDIDPVHWFLHPRDDVRSSFYLEDAATEFQVQGLELDWACVVWDGDFRHSSAGWEHRSFRGNKWQRIRKNEDQNYLKNAYRVLLTRARQGMAIVVPRGDGKDPTRLPEMYDSTYEYLRSMSLEVLK